jgi:hypothetical protein
MKEEAYVIWIVRLRRRLRSTLVTHGVVPGDCFKEGDVGHE